MRHFAQDQDPDPDQAEQNPCGLRIHNTASNEEDDMECRLRLDIKNVHGFLIDSCLQCSRAVSQPRRRKTLIISYFL